jgi:hypothetical protein
MRRQCLRREGYVLVSVSESVLDLGTALASRAVSPDLEETDKILRAVLLWCCDHGCATNKCYTNE